MQRSELLNTRLATSYYSAGDATVTTITATHLVAKVVTGISTRHDVDSFHGVARQRFERTSQ